MSPNFHGSSVRVVRRHAPMCSSMVWCCCHRHNYFGAMSSSIVWRVGMSPIGSVICLITSIKYGLLWLLIGLFFFFLPKNPSVDEVRIFTDFLGVFLHFQVSRSFTNSTINRRDFSVKYRERNEFPMTSRNCSSPEQARVYIMHATCDPFLSPSKDAICECCSTCHNRAQSIIHNEKHVDLFFFLGKENTWTSLVARIHLKLQISKGKIDFIFDYSNHLSRVSHDMKI